MKRRINLSHTLFLFCVFVSIDIKSISIGSLVESIQYTSSIFFPEADIDNEIIGFTKLFNGFSLARGGQLSFSGNFPISGNISLNGGILDLNTDLYFGNSLTFTSLGEIRGNGLALNFPESFGEFGDSSDNVFSFKNICLSLNADVLWNTHILFQGNCVIDAHGKSIDFNSIGSLRVDSGAHLIIRNALIRSTLCNNISCIDDTGHITLQDIHLLLDGTCTFSQGALDFKNDVIISGDGTSFIYKSSEISTIKKNSRLIFDMGVTFSYDPIIDDQTRLRFVDKTSVLELRGGSLYVASPGMKLTKGSLFVTQNTHITCEKNIVDAGEESISIDKGIMFGDGLLAEDCIVYIAAGCTVDFDLGTLSYNNMGEHSWIMGNQLSMLSLASETQLKLYESLDLGFGRLKIGNYACINRALNKDIIGSVFPDGVYFNLNFG